MRTNRAVIAAAITLFAVAACTSDPAQPVPPPGGTEATVASVSSNPAPSSDALKVGAGSVTGAGAYMADTDQQWRSSIAQLTKTDANVADTARCYFVTDQAGSFMELIACGPIRRADTAEGAVWDMFTARVDNATTGLTEASPAKEGATRPEGTLYRPDGATPAADADQLPEPPKPEAPAGTVAVVDASAVKPVDPVTVDMSKNTIITPTRTFTVTAAGNLDQLTGVTTALSGDVTEGKTYVPAAGQQLMFVTLGSDPQPSTAITALGDLAGDGEPGAVTVTLQVGDTKTDLTGKLIPENSGEAAASTTLAFSVPTGAKPTLTVDQDGHPQMLDLTAASRTTELPGLYLQNPVIAVNESAPKFTATYKSESAPNTIGYTLTVKSVAFTPYDPTAGWAPDGQMWAEMVVNHEFEHGGEITLDTTGWKVTANGKPVTAVNADAANTDRDVALTYPVPADTTTIDGTLTTKFTYFETGINNEPQTYNPKPLTFTANVK
ncbi:hypothetical protein ABLG96_01775 [Nakamurella sp. A5-74]|uniref:Lipoprotein n=1 Tax=Nakamurella sp. A5-74 TaxID=3158264 RepID=A0AAU8DS38_9ACTN